ncbi:MAG: thermonuclease family protein [Planctomycetaceae bacterium]
MLPLVCMVATALAFPGCRSAQEVDPNSLRRGETFEVSVVGVHDGDSLTGLTGEKRQVKIRLDSVDAPELGQPFGKAAKRALSEKVFGKPADIVVVSHDPYGRIVARVRVAGRDVAADLVREGFAWCDPRFNHDASLAALDQAARRSKKGLWADTAPTAPWDYRKHRERKSEPPAASAPASGSSWFRWWGGAGEK